MAEFRMDPSAAGHIAEIIAKTKAKLVTEIAEDARRFAPKRTGEMAAGIEANTETGQIHVPSPGVFVEMGHEIVAWGHHTGRQKAPEPFMRPALYRERGL